MAIKFTDKAPEGERSKKADAPALRREPDADTLRPSVDPELLHAKPTTKKRGRK